MKFIKLYNNVKIPQIGFGTAGLKDNTYHAVLTALNCGFRHIDSAQAIEWYKEIEVGKALIEFNNNNNNIRKEFWITTKLHKKNHGYDSAMNCLFQSFKNLNIPYVDLYLLHHPGKNDKWKQSWRALEYLYDKGHTKSIGVSNFGLKNLQTLIEWARIWPHIVQNWMDPFHQDKEIRDFCENKGIVYIAYSTLGGQWCHRVGKNIVQENLLLKNLSKKYDVSIYFLILSWALQITPKVVIIPRSSQHIEENSKLLDKYVYLLPTEIQAINDLDLGD